MTNNTAGLIAMLDAVTPTVEDIAGEDHFPERDRHALDDLNYYIQKAQHLANQPRVKAILENWNGQRAVRPRQRPDLEDFRPTKRKRQYNPNPKHTETAIGYIQNNPGTTCEDLMAVLNLSRAGAFAHLQKAMELGAIERNSLRRPIRYYPKEAISHETTTP